ncbi:MAG: hypothetical protein ABIG61_10825 [Planctomycetota bacterium]
MKRKPEQNKTVTDKVNITYKESAICILASAYKCCISLVDGMAELMLPDGNLLVKFPVDVACVQKDGSVVRMAVPLRCVATEEGFDLFADNGGFERMRVVCAPRWIEFTYIARARQGRLLEPKETLYFLRNRDGMQLKHCIEGFDACPKMNMEAEENYRSIFPISDIGSYFSPPPQVLSLRMPAGWFSMGLSRLPDSNVFKLTSDRGLLVETPCGHLSFSDAEEYAAPGVFFMFPAAGWEALALYRQILIERDIVTDTPIEQRNLPGWWKWPFYCTYGDQMMELQRNEYQDIDWGCDAYNSQWVRNSVEHVESKLGRQFNVIIDAFWTEPNNFDPVPSERFKDMKELIKWCHDRGHKVLLWCKPFVTSTQGECGTLAKKYGVLKAGSDYHIDYTSPGADAYLKELCEGYFSADGLDADGMKMDFLNQLAGPDKCCYCCPQAGIGMREVALFCRKFSEIARGIKRDVCINFSAADVRFSEFISMNRLHDVHASLEEKLRRARISAAASPNTIIDSDGAVMFSHWLEEHYLLAALFGTCSLYYSRVLHDNVAITEEEWKILRALFELSAKKPWGRPVALSYKNWQLVSNGKAVGQTLNGQLIMIFTKPNEASLLSIVSNRRRVPTLGRQIGSILPEPESLKITRNYVTARWQRGVIYRLVARGEIS